VTGVEVLLGVLVLSTVLGLVHRARRGRFRSVRRADAAPRGAGAALTGPDAAPTGPDTVPQTPGAAPAPPAPGAALAPPGPGAAPAPPPPDPGLRDVLAVLGETPGERATLLQFSSAFCAPCRATRRILSDVAELVPGVRHVEVDAEQHLDVVRQLKIMKTPTTLVLDADTRVVSRASGQPKKDEVLAALGNAVP
jgi:thiol-disulfide isomerase/thioredoxin